MSDKTAEVLLPCPFCGGEGEFKPYKRDGLTLKCKSLGCVRFDQRTMRYDLDWLRGKMIESWNTRAALPVAAPAVPEGMALVPIEPSPDMIAAMDAFNNRKQYLSHPEVPYHGTVNGDSMDAWETRCATQLWQNMLAAVPQAGALEGGNQ